MSKLTLLVILAASAIALPAERKHQSEKLMVHDAKTQQVGLQQKNHGKSNWEKTIYFCSYSVIIYLQKPPQVKTLWKSYCYSLQKLQENRKSLQLHNTMVCFSSTPFCILLLHEFFSLQNVS